MAHYCPFFKTSSIPDHTITLLTYIKTSKPANKLMRGYKASITAFANSKVFVSVLLSCSLPIYNKEYYSYPAFKTESKGMLTK